MEVSFAAFLCPRHMVHDDALGRGMAALRRTNGREFTFALPLGSAIEPVYNLQGDPMARVILRPGSTRIIRLIAFDKFVTSSLTRRGTVTASSTNGWRRETCAMETLNSFAVSLPWRYTTPRRPRSCMVGLRCYLHGAAYLRRLPLPHKRAVDAKQSAHGTRQSRGRNPPHSRLSTLCSATRLHIWA